PQTAGAAIDNTFIQIAQILRTSFKLRQRQDWPIGIEGEYPNQKVLTIGGVAPKYVMPIRVKRPSACDPRYGASRFEVAGRKWILRGKPVLARALKKDIAVEQRDDFK